MQRQLLDGLLRVLGPDPQAAGHAYRALHARLVRFFRLHAAADPETLADTALDRLAQRLATADRNPVGSPAHFAVGIAQHLLQEENRRRQREEQVSAEWAGRPTSPDAQKEHLLDRVEQCLDSMRGDQRDLLRSYYQWTGRAKIEHHRTLAAQMGLSLNALRNRLMRARTELDRCVRERARDIPASRDIHT